MQDFHVILKFEGNGTDEEDRTFEGTHLYNNYFVYTQIYFRSPSFYRRLLLMDANKTPILRTVWCRQRCKEYWEAVKLGVFGESWWQENLRMSQHSFVALCTELGPHICKQVTKIRLPVPVDTQLAVTI